MSQPIEVIGGIDTHTDLHQDAVIDTIGWHLATEAFPTKPAGYRDLLEWLHSHGQVQAVGMEGTGSFGAELPATSVLRACKRKSRWFSVRSG